MSDPEEILGIALELLDKYQEAQRLVINEYASNPDMARRRLNTELNAYRLRLALPEVLYREIENDFGYDYEI